MYKIKLQKMENSSVFFLMLRGEKKAPIFYGKQNPGDTKIYQSLAYSVIKGGLNLRRLANLRLRSKSALFPTLHQEGFFTVLPRFLFFPHFSSFNKNFGYLIYKGNCLKIFRKVSASPETKGTLSHKYRRHFVQFPCPKQKLFPTKPFLKHTHIHTAKPRVQFQTL